MNTQTFCAGYSQFYLKMFNIANSILENDEEARDVVASVFTHAFENKAKINEKTFENLMSVSVKNKSKDMLRGGRAKYIIHVPAFNENILSVEEDFSNFDEKCMSYRLNKAIEELPPIQKKLIKLKYLEGMDRRTMTSICNSTENTVRNNLALGLKNLRLKLINNH